MAQNKVVGPGTCSSFEVEGSIDVEGGATLTFRSGVTVRFSRGHGITVGEGRLVIEDATLTSNTPEPAPSDRWAGIAFTGAALPGSRLIDTVIQDAGQEGCISIRNTAQDVVTLQRVTLQRCNGAGLWVDAERIRLMDSIVFQDSETGLSLAARNVGDVTVPLTYQGVEKNVLRGGQVLESASWNRTGRPVGGGGRHQCGQHQSARAVLGTRVDAALRPEHLDSSGRSVSRGAGHQWHRNSPCHPTTDHA